jgi:alpha-L-rhamnosidase
MGQNFAGWIRLRVRGEAGATVKLRFGELTYPDGTLNVMTSVAGQIKAGKENRDNAYPQLAYQGDTYILSGRGDEVYTPRFTWHAFRYVEISGFPGKPGLDSLEGLRLSADVSQAGTFGCSHAPFNQIQEMVRWTFLSNLFSVQSDCPHRERFGYGGDIVPTCDAFLLNFDMATFYAKVVRDFADAARPNGGTTEIAPYNGIADAGFGDGTGPLGWQMAYPILLGKLYQYYGDRRLIEEHYPTVQKQLELVRSHAKDYIVTQCLGDHETIEERSVPLTTTAFFYHQAILASQFASLLNRRSEAQQYRELADNIRNAFVAKFFHADTGKLDIGVQACQAFGLHYDLVPPERRSDVLKVLVGEVERHQGHLTTGIFGTRYLLETLSRNGQADVAYHIVNQEGFPGWRHMLERGATTLWEHWEFSDNTYSHNHPMFGSVSAWFFEDLGGIRPADDANGFDRIVVGPNIVRGLTSAEATYDSIRGPVASRWRVADGKLQMMVTVPPNAQATVRLPTSNPGKVLETGKPLSEAPGVQVQATESKAAVLHIGSGEYRFEAEID